MQPPIYRSVAAAAAHLQKRRTAKQPRRRISEGDKDSRPRYGWARGCIRCPVQRGTAAQAMVGCALPGMACPTIAWSAVPLSNHSYPAPALSWARGISQRCAAVQWRGDAPGCGRGGLRIFPTGSLYLTHLTIDPYTRTPIPTSNSNLLSFATLHTISRSSMRAPPAPPCWGRAGAGALELA
jgi:hypothetical protein